MSFQPGTRQPVVCIFGLEPESPDVQKYANEKFKTITTHFYKNDENLTSILVEKRPGVLVTVGRSWKLFSKIANLPYQFRHRWLHYESIDEIEEQYLYYCWKHVIFNGEEDQDKTTGEKDQDKTTEKVDDKPTKKVKDYPLLSIFTTSYKSKHRIQRPLQSILAQTYTNWEWVIFDDTPAEHNNDENWKMLTQICKSDPRIRIYRSHANSGLIGEVKHNAASLCRGDLLLEIDHDDDLVPQCFQWIVDAYKEFPEAGFFYTDCAEIDEHGTTLAYGDGWGLGYGAHYYMKFQNRWLIAEKTPFINPTTIRHIVAVPNHIRVWTREAYQNLGGYNVNLSVADDYELIIRSFLKYPIVYIPKMAYIQYRNDGGNNFTVIRNDEIQKLVDHISHFYNKRIHARWKELGIPDKITNWDIPCREHDPLEIEQHCVLISDQDPEEVSIVLPTYNNSKGLTAAIKSVLRQTYTKWELIICGDECPTLANTMDRLINKIDHRVRWWNLSTHYTDHKVTTRNHILRCLLRTPTIVYMSDTDVWSKNHLETLVKAYLEISDLYLVQNGYLIHDIALLQNFGYWKSTQEELISRWNTVTNTKTSDTKTERETTKEKTENDS